MIAQIAEWTGVPLRAILERAGITADARDVLPEGLDELRIARPMPLVKAMADDTVVALAMNGEVLLADHGLAASTLTARVAASARAHVYAVVSAGLGALVVAEGVETQAQAEGLRLLGCPLAQGYLYSRPRPVAELVAELAPASRAAV